MLTYRMKKSQAGVTLVELMIAMVVGLIVIGATIGLVVSLMRSNSESIRSTRLSQEMRALADLATMEIRRARSLDDPLANVGEGATAFTQCNAITPGDNNRCLTFAYGCNPVDGAGSFRVIRQSGNNLVIGTGTSALNCTGGGTQLNAPDLIVESASFTQTSTGAIRMSLQGRLASDANMRRTLTRVIWPRSAPVTP